MTTYLDTAADSDTFTWAVTGDHMCNVSRCSQDAAIVVDSRQAERFCVGHTHEAAAVAHSYPGFAGWYRIAATRYKRSPRQLILTVHPL